MGLSILSADMVVSPGEVESGRATLEFIVENQKVRRDRNRVQLPQHGGELTAVIRRVVHNVVHLAPERVSPRLTLQVLIRHDCAEAFGGDGADEGALLGLEV